MNKVYPATLPTDAEQLAVALADPHWRLFSGCLYQIMIKGDGGETTSVIPFIPNWAQRLFIENLWFRNLILKARQLGFTTLIAIMWLDHALFNANQRCGIVAQDLEAAGVIFRDKVRFAYEHLPDVIRERFPLARDSASELLFAHNNSSVRVATSMRSGTIHRLHISEFGKICAKFPEKAAEVITGSIPAVPVNGIAVIESTAEGRTGEFFDMTQRAMALLRDKVKLTPQDYRFNFFPWWQEERYRMNATLADISQEEHEKLDVIEAAAGTKFDPEQRAWYMSKLRAEFAGREERMWQEYPSTPSEAFQVSVAGNYYAKDIADIRHRGGITNVPVLDVPVNTFWDIGNSDGCAIWFHQELRGEDRFIDYYEAHGETLNHYVHELKAKGFTFGTHFLPHDAAHKRLSDYNKSTQEMLSDLMPGENFVIVPRVTELMTGIHQVRKHMRGVWMDEKRCEVGISRLEGYKKKFSRSEMRFTDAPDKSNGCSEGADAFRQYAQAKELNMLDARVHVVHDEDYLAAPDWRL